MHRLTELSLEYPRTTLVLTVLIAALMAASAARVRTVYGHRVLIGDDHPTIVELDRFMAEFGGGLPALVMWDCDVSRACEHPLDDASLELADDFVRTLLPLAAIRNVVAPTNAPLLLQSEDGFAVRRLVEYGERPADRERLVSDAYRDELWVGQLFSKDRHAGALWVQPATDKTPADEQIVDALLALYSKWEARGFELALGGSVVDSVIGTRALIASQSKLTPFTVLLTAIVLILLSRSWKKAAFALLSVGVALLLALGVLGILDWPQDSVFQVMAPLILIIGVCDAIHYLGRAESLAAERAWPEALLAAADEVQWPCLVTTATTVFAFLSFLTSGLDTFMRFGTIAAVGIAGCLVVTFSVLPALCVLFDRPSAPLASAGSTRDGLGSAVAALTEISISRARPILAAVFIAMAIFSYGWFSRLSVEVDWHESFGEQSQIVQWDEATERRFGPNDMRLEVELVLPPEEPIEDPSSLAEVDRLATGLGAVPGLQNARSVIDYIRQTKRLLENGANGDHVPPSGYADTIEGNAEILELISFGDQELLSYWLSFDRSRARVSLEGTSWSSTEVEALMREVEGLVAETVPASWGYSITGGLPMTRDWVEAVQSTQVRSFPVAFAIVWLCVAFFLRSATLGLVAMIPSLVPVVLTLGAMGWLGMSLDVSRAMIAAIIIGIGVDDSIHLLSHFRAATLRGLQPVAAIRESVERVGRAVVTTSLALAAGFLSLMASAWQSISSFGFFVSLAILGALVATLVVLPALVAAFPSIGRRVVRE